MPFLRRRFIEPIHFKWNRSPLLSYWRELEATQYLPEEVLRDHQWTRLRELLTYVHDHNAFYRKRFQQNGIEYNSIMNPEDFARIPVLEKKEIKENIELMISDGYCIRDLIKLKTGGSTGKSLEFFISEECSEMRNACARRHDRWSGWEVGEPFAALWGNPVIPSDLRSRFLSWLLKPGICLDTMNITDDTIMRFAEECNRVKPTLLFGHAHSIFLLAEYMKRMGIDTIRPRAIISTSMMLMPHERKCIEEVFGFKVTDRYGCEEVSLIASECERHEGMHLNIEHLFIEFIREDGRPAGPGEYGNIIVTDLMNRAMPFIRYKVDDMGEPSNRRCSCGRGMPLMERVVGRTADFLIRQDGSRVAGVSLIENTLTRIPGIDQMQIIQKDIDYIIINLVDGPGYSSKSQEELIKYMENQFGRQVKVEVCRVSHIPSERNGKFRFSICMVSPASF